MTAVLPDVLLEDAEGAGPKRDGRRVLEVEGGWAEQALAEPSESEEGA